MRICCGLIGNLELAQRQDLYGSPVVVGAWEQGDNAGGRALLGRRARGAFPPREDAYVIAASEEALPFGVMPGMPLRQAEHLCSHATFVPPNPVAAMQLRELIASALYDLAPVVEVRVEGLAWLDVSGVPKPGESIRETRRRLRAAIGREPRLGLAPGPFSSRLAAARARPGRLMRIEDAREFLAPLSSHELPLDEEQLERLDLLGLRTLQAVAALGQRELESQLGRAGRHAVQLARGLEPDQLSPWSPPLFTNTHREFDPPVEDREALLFVARALCSDLAEELGLRGAGAKQVRVRLIFESGSPEERDSVVRHPLSSAAELFGLIGAWIKEWQPHAPITELWIELPVLEGAGRRQLRLWAGGDGTSDEVIAAFERLQERHGDEVVRQPRPALLSSPLPARRFA
jgi:DNA polymerase-4